MIIPVRCFGCGKVLADKWEAYVDRCMTAQLAQNARGSAQNAQSATSAQEGGQGTTEAGANGKTVQGRVLDALGITTQCCRAVMLTHVDLSHSSV